MGWAVARTIKDSIDILDDGNVTEPSLELLAIETSLDNPEHILGAKSPSPKQAAMWPP